LNKKEDKRARGRESGNEDPLLGEPVPRSFSVAGGLGWVLWIKEKRPKTKEKRPKTKDQRKKTKDQRPKKKTKEKDQRKKGRMKKL
jgi:hypothetical protein